MRITFDSNAWEAIFRRDDVNGRPIRTALEERMIEGFICAAGFGIEAIAKRNRPTYFAQPYMDVSFGIVRSEQPGEFSLAMSMGPDNRKHPGLPAVQVEKLQRAFATGIKLMRGQNWMGLPVPIEISDPCLYVPETREEAGAVRAARYRFQASSTSVGWVTPLSSPLTVGRIGLVHRRTRRS